jgi:pyrimidine-nucleoside phosphorylase
MVDIISRKKEAFSLSEDEIKFAVSGFVNGKIPDYQMAALLMAIRLAGFDENESFFLTKEMTNYGSRVDLSEIPGIKVDKHSTGGIGDKTTLIITPMAAACGGRVAKMSGRGLGDTGGTVDKLESIPGYRTEISPNEFIANIKKTGACICGHSADFATADTKIYNLRNDTATTDSMGLIASSIMSKKITSGADKILLDVKAGSGAFMQTFDEAKNLALLCREIGRLSGKEVRAVITDMDTPLGAAVGNSLEIKEVIETLNGGGLEDLRGLCVLLAAHMLNMAGLGSLDECTLKAQNSLKDGSAFNKFLEMAENAGADTKYIKNPALFENAGIIRGLVAKKSGFIEKLNAKTIGRASFILGAGRAVKNADVDFSAGVVLKAKQGEYINAGDLVCVLHTNNENAANEAEKLICENIVISSAQPPKVPLVYEVLA